MIAVQIDPETGAVRLLGSPSGPWTLTEAGITLLPDGGRPAERIVPSVRRNPDGDVFEVTVTVTLLDRVPPAELLPNSPTLGDTGR